MRSKPLYVVALLGVVLGFVAALFLQSVIKKRAMDVNSADWSKLNLVLQQVRQNYVDEVNVPDLTDAAIVAALAKLDPHSVYLPPVEQEQAESDLAGNFDGIGIQFNVPNDTAIVLEVIPGGPSEKAGLLPGDRILEVGGKVIAGVKFPQDSMVRRMKGPAGTTVNIKIGRDKETVSFDIVRGKIPIHCVDASFMLNDTTGYIRLTKFSATTYQEVTQAALSLVAEGMRKLVLDLRDNTGGYFNQAILLANMFLGKDASIVYLEGLHRNREEFTANGKGPLQAIDLVVVLNESSASSSEIFAGAIQDNDRGVLVGRRSFGKGLVQEPLFFSDGSAVRISVARYYTPSGRCIQRPYTSEEEYSSDLYRRYTDGEMFSADSVRTDTTELYYTAAGRRVYGGGGILPDIYVPMDTTRATNFYIKCNRKSLSMKFASAMFDTHKAKLSVIDNYGKLESYLETLDLEKSFLRFAARAGVIPAKGEWAQTKTYMLPQLRALIGRYSKLGQEAYYRFYLPIDDTIGIAETASL